MGEIHIVKCVVCGTQKAKVWYADLNHDWCELHVPTEFKIAADAKRKKRYG